MYKDPVTPHNKQTEQYRAIKLTSVIHTRGENAELFNARIGVT